MADLELILPTEKTPAKYVSPRVLVLYSHPKAGKTTILAQLEKSLILDLERGTDLVEARKLSIIGLVPPGGEPKEQLEKRYDLKDFYLSEAITVLRKGHSYKYLIVDTLTQLESWCIWDATFSYMNSPIGKNFNRYDIEDQNLSGGRLIAGHLKPKNEWKDVLTLPKGAGYSWLRDSYEKWLTYLKPLAPYMIYTAHLKLSQNQKESGEVEVKDLDLTGKIKSLTTQLVADATGYFYRDGKKGYISFEATDEVRCGSRAGFLSDQHILISEKLEDKTIKTYWENIYKD